MMIAMIRKGSKRSLPNRLHYIPASHRLIIRKSWTLALYSVATEIGITIWNGRPPVMARNNKGLGDVDSAVYWYSVFYARE